ncbi:MAG: nucleotide exchange factor GrpE [Owenweeksia sp.]|nr:nucleotide exchange factor GrpE [Owenweeksia sp.]
MSEKQDLNYRDVNGTENQEELKAEQSMDQPEIDETQAEAAEEAEESDPLQEIKSELADLKNQNLRLHADFENFRKRTAKERMDLYSTANTELMEALLPVLDDFNRALKANEGDPSAEGVHLIYGKLENTLKNKGLKPMEDTTGKEFDVDSMEAITRIPAPEKKLKGKVVDEIERGYLLGNKILRYAKVVVGE